MTKSSAQRCGAEHFALALDKVEAENIVECKDLRRRRKGKIMQAFMNTEAFYHKADNFRKKAWQNLKF
jgi:hypothetical protein